MLKKRFLAYGWHVVHADAYDNESIRKAIVPDKIEKESRHSLLQNHDRLW
jgi:transketolase